MTTGLPGMCFLICFVWWLEQGGTDMWEIVVYATVTEAAAVKGWGQNCFTVLPHKPQKTSCDVRQPAITQMVAWKIHMSDISCHYQAIIIPSSEKSACQSHWHAFSLFQWYTFSFCISAGKSLWQRKLSYFQHQSVPCGKCLAVPLRSSSASETSENKNILTALSSLLCPWCMGMVWCRPRSRLRPQEARAV